MTCPVECMQIQKSGMLSRSSFPNWIVGSDHAHVSQLRHYCSDAHDLSSKEVSVVSCQNAALPRTGTLLNSSYDPARAGYVQAAVASARSAAANGKSRAQALRALA